MSKALKDLDALELTVKKSQRLASFGRSACVPVAQDFARQCWSQWVPHGSMGVPVNQQFAGELFKPIYARWGVKLCVVFL